MIMKRIIIFLLISFGITNINAQEFTDTVINTATIEVDGTAESRPSHSLSFGYGPAWITSTVMTDFDAYKWRCGQEYSIEYGCVFRKGFGFGLSFLRNRTSYPLSGSMKQTYIGPTFIYERIFWERWKFRGDISLGYTSYKDDANKDEGFGGKMAVSMEYMLSDKLSVGIRLMEGSVLFDDDPYEYETDGIDRLGVMAGLTIIF